MKKLLHIPVICLFMLSGMQLTIATHYCREVLTHTSIAFAGHEPGCGMEKDMPSGNETGISAVCCTNSVLAFQVDNTYMPSDIHLLAFVSHAVHLWELPFSHSFSHCSNLYSYADASPPGFYFQPGAVNLSVIKVFRI